MVWILPRFQAPPPPPPATYTEEADGVRVAHLDADTLRAWCRGQRLPDPPVVRDVEPMFGQALLDALHRAASERSAEAFGLVGMLCESVESHGAAREYFLLAERTNAADPRWPYYLGCLYQVTGRPSEAADALVRALERDSFYPVTHARLAQLDLERGDLDAASGRFARYTELNSTDWLGLVGSARVALQRGEPERALTLLQTATARGGDDFQVNHQLARTYAALGDRDRAAEFFARAKDRPQGAWYRLRDPRDQALHDAGSPVASLQAQFERLSGTQDWSALIRIGEEIVRRRSGDVNMMGNLAGLYRKSGRFADAHAMLDRALETGTDLRRLHLLRGEVALAENDFPRALAAADRAASLDAESGRAHGLRARALLMLERPSEAESAMTRSLELEPSRSDNLLVLGEIRFARGDLEGAETAYRASLALQESAHARSRLTQILSQE